MNTSGLHKLSLPMEVNITNLAQPKQFIRVSLHSLDKRDTSNLRTALSTTATMQLIRPTVVRVITTILRVARTMHKEPTITRRLNSTHTISSNMRKDTNSNNSNNNVIRPNRMLPTPSKADCTSILLTC